MYLWVEKIRELLQDKLYTNQQIPAGIVDGESTQNTNSDVQAAVKSKSIDVSVDPVAEQKFIDHFSNSLSVQLEAGVGYGADDDGDGSKRLADLSGKDSDLDIRI